MTIQELATKMNEALAAKGYKREEASASVWMKDVKPGVKLERVYLNGKKANGFLTIVDGKIKEEKCSFRMILDTIEEVAKCA